MFPLYASIIITASDFACKPLATLLASALIMAKPKKVALNRWVLQATIDGVKAMAEALGCTEGEVLDQAVEFFEVHQGGDARVVISSSAPTSSQIPSTLAAGIPGVSLGAATGSANHCVHCERAFERLAGMPPTSMCGKCRAAGHWSNAAQCRPCATARHLAGVAAADKTGSGRDDIEYDAQG